MRNRLASETSPYLRQHAHNPVDWWPWCDAALDTARGEDKPILLSIGYSACHWCHVMAHESFEDEATAALMNDLFVNIKVDREERPDLDKIYQLAHQALARRGGGWPLTVFLSPEDLVPFHAGTYFPKQARYGMPAFADVLAQVRAWWDRQRDQVREQNDSLARFLAGFGRDGSLAQTLDEAPIAAAVAQIRAGFDHEHGGPAGAPKFPHCPQMELLLDLAQPDMVELTLTHMAAGGIHDQIGSGFCRYSVDERWEIPHFEKMLYDNAQLLPLYARMERLGETGGDPAVADALVEWLQREMTAPDGGFYSALDADSEGEEGRFYVWQREEVRRLLDPGEFAVAASCFGFDRPPNFENTAWNPIVAVPIEHVARKQSLSIAEARQRLRNARAKLFAARCRRVRPGLDDKVLCAWNALMISGLARSARERDVANAAQLRDAALTSLYRSAWRDGRLYAAAAGNAAKLPAYLDDHAFLLDALIECLQCRWNARDLAWAIDLADALLERFEDRDGGGFFFTASDHETLIQRPKPWIDEATPSGNGVAARSLLRLGHLIGEPRYLDAAERTLRGGYAAMEQMPQACASMLRALNDLLHPRTHVVIRCADPGTHKPWQDELMVATNRRCDAYWIPSSTDSLPGVLNAQQPVGNAVAYLCRGAKCLPPISSAADLTAALEEADSKLR